jgi:hypothetical protein
MNKQTKGQKVTTNNGKRKGGERENLLSSSLSLWGDVRAKDRKAA